MAQINVGPGRSCACMVATLTRRKRWRAGWDSKFWFRPPTNRTDFARLIWWMQTGMCGFPMSTPKLKCVPSESNFLRQERSEKERLSQDIRRSANHEKEVDHRGSGHLLVGWMPLVDDPHPL